MKPWLSATRGSGKWISLLAARPTRSQSPSTSRFASSGLPPRLRVWVMTSSFKAPLPVDEHGDHVHRERRDERDRQRHVDVQPQVEDRLVAHRAARAREELVLLEQQRVDLAVGVRGLAG